MTSYILTLHAAPWSNQSVATACDFAEAAIAMGKEVKALFLYQDAVLNASNSLDIPSDEFNGSDRLSALHNKFGTKILLCVTAASKRGLNQDNINKGYTIAGLAEFAEMTTTTDNVIQFKWSNNEKNLSHSQSIRHEYISW